MNLVDANVLMYAAGAEHPHKERCVKFLERIAMGELEGTIDTEVLQEVLHRYRSIGRWADGQRVYDLTRRLFPHPLPVTADVMDRARLLLDSYRSLSARDALHGAVVILHSAQAIYSFDRDFDVITGVTRREP